MRKTSGKAVMNVDKTSGVIVSYAQGVVPQSVFSRTTRRLAVGFTETFRLVIQPFFRLFSIGYGSSYPRNPQHLLPPERN